MNLRLSDDETAAVGRSRSSAFGDDAHPTFATKAAALMQSLASNHALVDGNKRLGGERDVPQITAKIDARLR